MVHMVHPVVGSVMLVHFGSGLRRDGGYKADSNGKNKGRGKRK